jgi:hypothetical protein
MCLPRITKIGYGNFLLCYIFTSVNTIVLNTGKNCFVDHKQDILMKVGVVEYFLNKNNYIIRLNNENDIL